MSRKRYLEEFIEAIAFSNDRMAFLSGPRQGGKTTLAKRLLGRRPSSKRRYYNWDELEFRRQWAEDPRPLFLPLMKPTPAKSASKKGADGKKTISQKQVGTQGARPLVVLDEIHKAKGWKRNLKGIYDTLAAPCDILVTGSARLNVYRKGSDSLLGRYYHFRLHPFSLSELGRWRPPVEPDFLWEALLERHRRSSASSREALKILDVFGPFPHPLLRQEKRILNLWHRHRLEQVIREDLRDLSGLPDLSQIEMLAAFLPSRASNLLSIASLSRDLEVAYTTIRRWLDYLQELYYHFEVLPYTAKMPRAIKKTHKLYLWDWSEIRDPGARFENCIAMHLLKYCHFLTDTGEGNFELRYLRGRQDQEIDFLILQDGKPWLPIEVKKGQTDVSRSWKHFLPHLPCHQAIQVVQKSGQFARHRVFQTEVLVVSGDELLRYLV